MSTSRSHRPPSLLPGPIGFLLIPQFTAIALASAVESLRLANRYVLNKYQWRLLSLDGQPVPDGNGMVVPVDGGIERGEDLGSVLIIADLHPEQYVQPPLAQWLRRQSARGVTLGGIDTAAHILARTGLLKEHRATLHWENAPAFRELHPDILVTSNLFEFDRGLVTCAGGTSAIDMMLYVIEREHGHEIAVRVSEHLMHPRIRKGSEQQRMEIPQRFGVHHPKLVEAIQIMEDTIEEPIDVSELSDRVGLSLRQLLRLFKEHLSSSPAKLYLHLRLERARRLIAQSDLSVIEIAVACGFQSHSHFSRVYRAQFGHSPQGERQSRTDPRLLVMDVAARE